MAHFFAKDEDFKWLTSNWQVEYCSSVPLATDAFLTQILNHLSLLFSGHELKKYSEKSP